MLVLSRRTNEKIVLPGLGVTIQLVGTKQGVAKIGIEAPPDVSVFRQEVLERMIAAGEPVPAAGLPQHLRHLVRNRLSAATIGLALLRRQLEMNLPGEMAGTLDKVNQEIESLRQQVESVLKPAAPAPRPQAKQRRALLVEDDRNECELLAGYLRLAGIDVHTAGDGCDALDHLRQQGQPDILLLDMFMPRCDGPNTVRAIRQNPAFKGLKIFGMSGGSPEQFGLGSGPDGIDRWFLKPLNPEALLRELRQELDGKA